MVLSADFSALNHNYFKSTKGLIVGHKSMGCWEEGLMEAHSVNG